MRWKWEKKEKVNKDPWTGWVKVRFHHRQSVLGMFYPHRCNICNYIFWLETFWFRKTGYDDPDYSEPSKEYKCITCFVMEELK